MEKFLFVYHGSQDPNMTKAEMDATIAAWGKWIETHAASWIDTGNPVEKSWTVSAQGVKQEYTDGPPVAGYGIIQAESYEQAVEIAMGCPDVATGDGLVEVAKIFEIPVD